MVVAADNNGAVRDQSFDLITAFPVKSSRVYSASDVSIDLIGLHRKLSFSNETLTERAQAFNAEVRLELVHSKETRE